MPENKNFTISMSENKKMHISLPISEETVLFGCNSFYVYERLTIIGNNISIYIDTNSFKKATCIFNDLSAGGKKSNIIIRISV